MCVQNRRWNCNSVYFSAFCVIVLLLLWKNCEVLPVIASKNDSNEGNLTKAGYYSSILQNVSVYCTRINKFLALWEIYNGFGTEAIAFALSLYIKRHREYYSALCSQLLVWNVRDWIRLTVCTLCCSIRSEDNLWLEMFILGRLFPRMLVKTITTDQKGVKNE